MDIGFCICRPKSFESLCNQVDSLVAVDNPMYFALEEERAIIGYFLEDQVIGFTSTINTKFIVNCPSYRSLIQSKLI